MTTHPKLDSTLTPRVDSRDPLTALPIIPVPSQVAIDAGFMRLAHRVCDKQPDPVIDDLFSSIPVIFRPRFRRAGSVRVVTLMALAIFAWTLGLYFGMIMGVK